MLRKHVFRRLWMRRGAVLVLAAVALGLVLSASAHRATGVDRAPANAPAKALPSRPAEKLDLAYIPANAVAAAIIHPHRMLTREALKLLPIEVLSVAGKKELGIDPLDVELAVALVANVREDAPPDYGAIIRLTKPHAIDAVLPQLQDKTQAAEAKDADGNAVSYRKADAPLPSFAMPDDRTLLVGSDAFLQKMLAAGGAEDALRKRLAEADVSADITIITVVEPLEGLLAKAMAEIPELPQDLAGVRRLPEQLDAVEFRLELEEYFRAELTLHGDDEQAAGAVETTINQALDFARQQALENLHHVAPSDPVEAAMASYAERMIDMWLSEVRPNRDGDRVVIDVESKFSAATAGVAVALMLPAVQAAREAARRVQSRNNMHQLVIAIHNYCDVHGKIPARAVYDTEGKPLLSWRVLMLPYIESGNLYDEFRLDEPWDSPHNMALIEQMPATYQNPNLPRDGKTTYLVPVAKGTVFSGKEGIPLERIGAADGTSNTIMLVEADADKAVIWTKPDDLPVDPKNAKAGLGKLRNGRILAAFADGSVRALEPHVTAQTLWKLFTFAGGEVLDERDN